MQIVATFDNYEEMVAFARKIMKEEPGAAPTEKKAVLPEAGEPVEEKQVPAESPIPEEEKAAPDKPPKEEKHYTLVDVRAKLAELSKAGKKAQVQELIHSFGAEKLSQIGEEHYQAMMEKAGEL